MSLQPRTRTVRSGIEKDAQFGSVMPPLHMSSNYTFAGLGQPRAHDYTRSGNPTRDLLSEALAELEGGAGAVVTSSGMSAITALLHTVSGGGRVVAPSDCYGGTHRLLRALEARGAIELVLAELWDPEALSRAVTPETEMLWVETPSNPLLRITDIRQAVEAARAADARVVVDNTFLSPALQQPIALGADYVVHSTTKYINGHSDVVGGAVVSAEEARAEEVGWWANCLGLTGSPFDSWQTLRGLRTLHLRMQAHLEGAAAVAHALVQHDAVEKVYWPGLITHPGAALAASQQSGPGAMISAELRGGLPAVRAFVEGLSSFTLAESLGGVESLVAHPATMTHASMPPEAQAKAGIREGLVRFSIGVEAPEDRVADVGAACDRADRVAVVGV